MCTVEMKNISILNNTRAGNSCVNHNALNYFNARSAVWRIELTVALVKRTGSLGLKHSAMRALFTANIFRAQQTFSRHLQKLERKSSNYGEIFPRVLRC